MEGTQFGRYQLQQLLGEGGMGQVYRAYDTRTDRVVAVKVLHAHVAADPVFRERFRREAKAAAALGDPHVVPIFDYGDIDGHLFICMQYLDGQGVDALLARSGPMPIAHAVSVLTQAADALQAAHAAGLVHRDVKPSNLFITATGFVYLIDFGIARAAGETGLTSVGSTIGTFAYMAPERFATGIADARADVYALACVLFELLTGRPPFRAVGIEQQIAAHLTQPPPRPSLLRPEVGTGIDAVIARGMAKDPDQRYQTAGDLATAASAAVSSGSYSPTVDSSTVATRARITAGAQGRSEPVPETPESPSAPPMPVHPLSPFMAPPSTPPGAGYPFVAPQASSSELSVSHVIDAPTISRMNRAIALAKWRSPRSWALMATIPLILMARRIIGMIAGAAENGPIYVLVAYFGVLAAVIVCGGLATGIQMLRRDKRIAIYAPEGSVVAARYHQDSLDLHLADGVTTIPYAEITELFTLAGAKWIRQRGKHARALPQELVPPAALLLIGRARRSTDLAKPIGVGLPDPPNSPQPAWGPATHMPVHPQFDGSASVTGMAAPVRRRRGQGKRVAGVVGVVVLGVAAVIAVTRPAILHLNTPTAPALAERAAIRVGGRPEAVAGTDGLTAYVVTDSAGLWVIDLASKSTVANVPIPGGYGEDVATDPRTNTIYVAVGNDDNTGSVLVLKSNGVGAPAIVNTIHLTRWAHRLALDPETHTLYVATGSTGTQGPPVTMVDTTTNAVTGTVDGLDSDSFAGEFAIDPVSHAVYTMTEAGKKDTFTTIDGSTHRVTAQLTLPSGNNISMAIDPATGHGYVGHCDDYDHKTCSVKTIDLRTDSFIGDAFTGTGQSHLAVDSATHTLYADNQEGRSLQMINTRSGAPINTIKFHAPTWSTRGISPLDDMDSFPGPIALDDSHTVYILDFSSGGNLLRVLG
ncbi:serine/threonine-protein kinase [Nocardia niigatensis]|uniref:serine/threonine-protein kinase n=1 Tax=Nocardia niigatensis TaxID=209249 RepID=UPI0002E5340F|nr:serine/threonine-protein kinase [Nocardia niigatensis]